MTTEPPSQPYANIPDVYIEPLANASSSTQSSYSPVNIESVSVDIVSFESPQSPNAPPPDSPLLLVVSSAILDTASTPSVTSSPTVAPTPTSFNVFIDGLDLNHLLSSGNVRKLLGATSDFDILLGILFGCMKLQIASIDPKAQFVYGNAFWTSGSGSYIVVTTLSMNARIPAYFAKTNVSNALTSCMCGSFHNTALTCVASPPPLVPVQTPPLPSPSTTQTSGFGAQQNAQPTGSGTSIRPSLGLIIAGCGIGVLTVVALVVIRRMHQNRLIQAKYAKEEELFNAPDNDDIVLRLEALSTFSESRDAKCVVTNPMFQSHQSVSETNPMFSTAYDTFEVVPIEYDGDADDEPESRLGSESFCELLKTTVLSDETSQLAHTVLEMYDHVLSGEALRSANVNECIVQQLEHNMCTLEQFLLSEQSGKRKQEFLKELQSIRATLQSIQKAKVKDEREDEDSGENKDVQRVMARLRRVRRNSLHAAATTAARARARMRWGLIRSAFNMHMLSNKPM